MGGRLARKCFVEEASQFRALIFSEESETERDSFPCHRRVFTSYPCWPIAPVLNDLDERGGINRVAACSNRTQSVAISTKEKRNSSHTKLRKFEEQN